MTTAVTTSDNIVDRLFVVLDTLDRLSTQRRLSSTSTSIPVSIAYQNAHDWILEALELTADEYRELTRDTPQAHTANSSTLNSKALHFK